MTTSIKKYIGALLLAALPSVPAMAQENTVNYKARDLENPLFGQPGVQASVNSGYDWTSSTEFQGGGSATRMRITSTSESARTFP